MGGEFGDDQGPLPRRVLQAHGPAHDDAPLTRRQVLADALFSHDRPTAGVIGAFDVAHEPVDIHLRVVEQRNAGGQHLPQVVRRDVGRKSDGNAGSGIDDGR